MLGTFSFLSFIANCYGSFWGLGRSVFFVLLRNSMNVFGKNDHYSCHEEHFHGKKLKNFNDKQNDGGSITVGWENCCYFALRTF